MSSYSDLGLNIPETTTTLLAQQKQLVEGRRRAQMFPKGTKELPLPNGFERTETNRGIFHFNPQMVTVNIVKRLSSAGKENLLLALGAHSKADVLRYVTAGEPLLVITERTPEGVEVKAAVGTRTTLPFQQAALESSKSPGSTIQVETVEQVLLPRMAEHAPKFGKVG